MLTILALVAAFILGVGIGAAAIIRQVRSGRIVIRGRIYYCRDTDSVVR